MIGSHQEHLHADFLLPLFQNLLKMLKKNLECKKYFLDWFIHFFSLFVSLAKDDTPMVRRAACLHFGVRSLCYLINIILKAFCKQLTKENVKDELIPTFQALAADEQDSVRLLSVENCVAIALMFSQDENVSVVLPVVRNCYNDKSWRVRYMVAEKFCDVRLLLHCVLTTLACQSTWTRNHTQ